MSSFDSSLRMESNTTSDTFDVPPPAASQTRILFHPRSRGSRTHPGLYAVVRSADSTFPMIRLLPRCRRAINGGGFTLRHLLQRRLSLQAILKRSVDEGCEQRMGRERF